MQTKCFLTICGIIAAIGIYFPSRHARHYDYIDIRDVYNELILDNYQINKTNLKICDYHEKLLNNNEVDIESIYDVRQFYKPDHGGEFTPRKCASLIKTAVVVPYRNRPEQLRSFLNYMHNFLQNQDLTYRIFIVDQNDSMPFNRAKMLNYGAKVAIDMNYPCLILHDVDLIPINTGNMYGCGKKPRHMSSSLDTFRFNLPYLTIVGGALAIQSQHFQRVNGMSNQFYGWGGEDDDFYKRLESHDLLPYRFAPTLSKYTMLVHKKEKASQDRYRNLQSSMERQKIDGLNSLPDNISIELKDLYTLLTPF